MSAPLPHRAQSATPQRHQQQHQTSLHVRPQSSPSNLKQQPKARASSALSRKSSSLSRTSSTLGGTIGGSGNSGVFANSMSRLSSAQRTRAGLRHQTTYGSMPNTPPLNINGSYLTSSLKKGSRPARTPTRPGHEDHQSMFAAVTREAAESVHAFRNPEVSIKGYDGVRPFSNASDPFKLQLTAVEVANCLDRLYAKPVEEQKITNEQYEDMINTQLLRMQSPLHFKELQRAAQRAATPSTSTTAAHSGADSSHTHDHHTSTSTSTATAVISPSKFAEKFYKQRLEISHGKQQALKKRFLADEKPRMLEDARAEQEEKRAAMEEAASKRKNNKKLPVNEPDPAALLNLKGLKLSYEDQDHFIQRLYNKRATKEEVSEKSAKKVYAKALQNAATEKKKDRFENQSAQQEFVSRLYDKQLDDMAKRKKESDDKYLWRSRDQRAGKKLVMSEDELQKVLTRLGAPGGGAPAPSA